MRSPHQKAVLNALVFLSLFIPALSHATESDTFTGKVVGVSDGDTISVMREGRAVKVRLHGIDCPEKKRPFGMRAKRGESDMVFGINAGYRSCRLCKSYYFVTTTEISNGEE